MMEVIMKNRLPVEHFHFPVEKIKAGYYTDAYFLRTEEILNGDNHHPRVMMQLFTREPVVVCGIDETIALIKTCAHNPENITIYALHDGDEVAPWETLMTIEGDLADFAHLETIYLGFLARQSRIATNVRRVVKAANGKPVLFFPARYDVDEVAVERVLREFDLFELDEERQMFRSSYLDRVMKSLEEKRKMDIENGKKGGRPKKVAKSAETPVSKGRKPTENQKRREEEKNIRSEAIQKETKYAAEVPMEVARIVHSILPMIDVVARKGNSNAVTDACVARMCARTAILGALLNVRINLTSIKDEKFVKEMTEEADMIEKTTIAEEQKILDYVKTVF